MCCCHGANAPLERCYEIVDRPAAFSGLGDDSTDGGECVLDTMVELGVQDRSSLLGSLALGDVDVDADHALCSVGLAILYVSARLDPPDRSAGTHYAALCMMLAAPLSKYLSAVLQKLWQVIWMDPGSPIAERDLYSLLGKAIDGAEA